MIQPIQCAVAKMMKMNLHPAIHRTSALRSSCLWEKYVSSRLMRRTRTITHREKMFTLRSRANVDNSGRQQSSSTGSSQYTTPRTLQSITFRLEQTWNICALLMARGGCKRGTETRASSCSTVTACLHKSYEAWQTLYENKAQRAAGCPCNLKENRKAEHRFHAYTSDCTCVHLPTYSAENTG